MTIHLCLVVLLSAAVAITGCNDDDASTRQSVVRQTNHVNAELQKRADAERDARRLAENQLGRERSSASWWQTTATVLAVATMTLFVAGIIIGSSARDESEQ